MQNSDRIHVGGYEAWMENGILTLHYHRAGQSGGFSMKLSPEETYGLLDLLSHNQDSIRDAVATSEEQHHHQRSYSHGAHDYYKH